MDWKAIISDIISDIISGVLVTAVCGFFAWLFYFVGIKGKDKDQRAHERKIEIYIPLKNQMKELTDLPENVSDLTSWERISIATLHSIAIKNDEYVVDETLYRKCKDLNDMVSLYNHINLYTVSRDILYEWFKEEYARLYGSTEHQIVYNDPISGDQVDLLEDDIEVEKFKATVNERKVIDKIVHNKGYDEFERLTGSSPVNDYIAQLCDGVLTADPCGGIQYDQIDDDDLRNHRISVGQFMVKGFNFFDAFDSNQEVMRKQKLLDAIREKAFGIYEDTQVIIRSIGKKYEKE